MKPPTSGEAGERTYPMNLHISNSGQEPPPPSDMGATPRTDAALLGDLGNGYGSGLLTAPSQIQQPELGSGIERDTKYSRSLSQIAAEFNVTKTAVFYRIKDE